MLTVACRCQEEGSSNQRSEQPQDEESRKRQIYGFVNSGYNAMTLYQSDVQRVHEYGGVDHSPELWPTWTARFSG
jgi:hypothetical protein